MNRWRSSQWWSGVSGCRLFHIINMLVSTWTVNWKKRLSPDNSSWWSSDQLISARCFFVCFYQGILACVQFYDVLNKMIREASSVIGLTPHLPEVTVDKRARAKLKTVLYFEAVHYTLFWTESGAHSVSRFVLINTFRCGLDPNHFLFCYSQ